MPIAELPALLESIAAMSKIAMQSAAAICVDDVAVNAKLLSGLERGHEGRAVKKVVRGSLLNKVILIPTALLVSAVMPGAVLPLLAVGGLHLASEGMGKLLGKDHDPLTAEQDTKVTEKKKIRAALKVDFILSAEITILTLSTVVGAPFVAQLAVLAATGAAVTAGLYGVIGGILKMNAAGQWLSRRKGNNPVSKAARGLGGALEKFEPHLMKGISRVGTVALFVIGGGLMLHGIPGAEQFMTGTLGSVIPSGIALGAATLLAETAVGLVAGLAAMPVMKVLCPQLTKVALFGKKLLGKIPEVKTTTANDNDAVQPVLVEASANALQQVSDVKAAMNTAAQRPANDDQSVAVQPAPQAKQLLR